MRLSVTSAEQKQALKKKQTQLEKLQVSTPWIFFLKGEL